MYCRSCSAVGEELLRRTEGVVGTMSRSANDVRSLSGGSLAPSRNGHASCSASLEEETSQNEDDLNQHGTSFYFISLSRLFSLAVLQG